MVLFRAGGTVTGQLARGNGPAAARPPGDAWSRVRREIDEVAGQTRQWPLQRARDLLHHHTGQSLNPAYRELVEDAGVDPVSAAQTAQSWGRVPVIDKQWLAGAGYHRRPACPGPVLIVATSGSTATRVLLPVTAECAHRGLCGACPHQRGRHRGPDRPSAQKRVKVSVET